MSKIIEYHFTCPKNHLIKKQYSLQSESGGADKTTVQVYCDFCDKFYSFDVEGDIDKYGTVHRGDN
ncbi:MAG: hypothetical protein R3E32_07545 [Chitinophagales bacterium]